MVTIAPKASPSTCRRSDGARSTPPKKEKTMASIAVFWRSRLHGKGDRFCVRTRAWGFETGDFEGVKSREFLSPGRSLPALLADKFQLSCWGSKWKGRRVRGESPSCSFTVFEWVVKNCYVAAYSVMMHTCDQLSFRASLRNLSPRGITMGIASNLENGAVRHEEFHVLATRDK